MTRRRTLSDAQRETARYLLSDPQALKRARSAGERVTLASLYRRGIAERRAWRGAEGSADAAHEYRPSVALALSYARTRASAPELRAADALSAHAETIAREHTARGAIVNVSAATAELLDRARREDSA